MPSSSAHVIPKKEDNFWQRSLWIREHYAKSLYQRFFVFFVDGIGVDLLQRLLSQYPEDFDWLKLGQLESITSLYPSTTSVHVPAFLGGIQPEKTGVVEWWYYEPLVGSLFIPLKFRRKDGKAFDSSLISSIFGPINHWPQGPKKFLWQESSYSHSVTTRYLAADFELNGYGSLEDLRQKLDEKLQDEQTQFHVLYLPAGDTMSHRVGPVHERTLEVWKEIFHWIGKQIKQDPAADYCLISDHGQCEIDPSKTIYLNHFLPGLREAFRRDDRGHILVPAGSCRNLLLYIEPSVALAWKEKIATLLGQRADVLTKEELIQKGYFLESPSGRFEQTFPSLVVLPRSGFAVWWDDGKPVDVWSQHGGVSPEEMNVPFWKSLGKLA